MSEIIAYRRPFPGTQPDYLFPKYASTVKRAPTRPLVIMPQTLTELTGPVFGYDEVKPTDNDLTKQHAGDPIGERIVLSGRVLDENGRPVPHTLVEIWQANSAGRYPGSFAIQVELLKGKDRAKVEELVLAELKRLRARSSGTQLNIGS